MGLTLPAAAAVDDATGANAPPAEGSVSRLAYLRARLAANAARRRFTKSFALLCRTLLTADAGKRWHSHRLRLVCISSSQVAVRGVVSPLLLWCLGLGVVRDCSVSCRDCVALASLDDACRCMSSPSQGLRWAFGQTSPLLSRVACMVGEMHLSCRYQAAPHPAHRPILGQSLLNSSTRASIFRPTWVLPRRPSGDRRIAPGVVNGLPSEAARLLPARRRHQRRRARPLYPLSCSIQPWLRIPLQLRAPAIGQLAREPAAFSPIGAMDTYMPVPEGLSFDHLDTLGKIGPHVYHLPFQDTLIPWSRRWIWGLRSPPALDDSTDLAEDFVSVQSVDLHDVHHICSDSSPELIPAAEGLCSAFCLDEDTEAAVAASKVPHPPHVPVPFCHRLTAAGSAPQGPETPRQQAGALLRFSISARSSHLRRRHGGRVPAHSAAPCTCLGSWQLNPALGSVSCAMSHTLRLGSITVHSHRGGNTSPTTSLVTTVTAWQTILCCDALLPTHGDHSVHWEAGASALLTHTGDACGPCSGGSDCSDRQCRSGFPSLSTCPAQRLARLANAVPPLSLRRVLRRRQSQRRPQSDDGSTPASYRRRSGVLITLTTSWPRPRRNWSPSPDLIFLNASGCCQKDVISLGSCKHFGRGSAFALVAVSSCYRHRQHLLRAPVMGLLCPPMFRAPGPRRQLPLTLERMLLVIGHEWRRGSACWLVRIYMHLLGGRTPCFRRSFCLRPSEERLALTEACVSTISVLRNPVQALYVSV